MLVRTKSLQTSLTIRNHVEKALRSPMPASLHEATSTQCPWSTMANNNKMIATSNSRCSCCCANKLPLLLTIGTNSCQSNNAVNTCKDQTVAWIWRAPINFKYHAKWLLLTSWRCPPRYTLVSYHTAGNGPMRYIHVRSALFPHQPCAVKNNSACSWKSVFCTPVQQLIFSCGINLYFNNWLNTAGTQEATEVHTVRQG